MKPSNPATFFVSGSDQREFRYDPGPDPYYIVIRGDHYIPLSTIVFASSSTHALDILKKMVDFMGECAQEYAKATAHYYRRDRSDERLRKVAMFRKALAGEDKFKIHIGQLDTDQMYRVGWASNDTF